MRQSNMAAEPKTSIDKLARNGSGDNERQPKLTQIEKGMRIGTETGTHPGMARKSIEQLKRTS
jgi:hypothetical protein